MAGYGDDSAFQAWLTENGHALPVGAPSPAVLRQRGSTYIDGAYGARFVGTPTGGYEQERAWPRQGALVAGSIIPDSVVPLPVIHASYEAALQEAKAPGSLSAVGSGAQQIKRAKAGPVEVEFQQPEYNLAAALVPLMTTVEGLLAPFLKSLAPAVGVGIWSIG